MWGAPEAKDVIGSALDAKGTSQLIFQVNHFVFCIVDTVYPKGYLSLNSVSPPPIMSCLS